MAVVNSQVEAARSSFGIEECDITDTQERLGRGELTSEALVKMYLARIAEINDKVKAVACLNPEAVALAVERDTQRKLGNLLGDLHGIPILIKDTFATTDKMDTTAGSFALVGAKYRTSSTVVQKLEAAGAIILGKTNMSEWGYSRSDSCSDGWSPLHGQVLGASHEQQNPEGPSSGSAVAARPSLASATIGGETCGSILSPAGRNGAVGLKATVGLVSRAGVIPVSPDRDTVGPMTKWVKDAAKILKVIAGKDKLDHATEDIPFDEIPDYVGACRRDGCQGLRIALPKSVVEALRLDAELYQAFDSALETLRSLGAVIVDNDDFDTWKIDGHQRDEVFNAISLREGFEKFFSELDHNPHGIDNVGDLIEFLKNTTQEEYDRFGAKWFEDARDISDSSESEMYLASKKRLDYLGLDPVRLLARTGCDLLVAVPTVDLPLDLGRLPGIAVPLGYYSEATPVTKGEDGLVTCGPNMPLSILFAGRRFDEEKLIACAYAFEQATRVADR
ncbi:amidase, partial [Echria macrotheca]